MDTLARLERQIAFIVEADKLKEIFRQSLNSQSRRRENDAEHSWALCLIVMTIAEYANVPNLNVPHVLKMLLIHDIVEIDAGDTFAYDEAAMATQYERESKAADRIFGLLPDDQAKEFRALWEEFEAHESAEAKFARSIDRFQPMLLNCLSEGAAWNKHGVTRDMVIDRNRMIADGCTPLWEFTQKMVEQAVEAGHLKR